MWFFTGWKSLLLNIQYYVFLHAWGVHKPLLCLQVAFCAAFIILMYGGGVSCFTFKSSEGIHLEPNAFLCLLVLEMDVAFPFQDNCTLSLGDVSPVCIFETMLLFISC